jgi:signal peptidase I
MPPEHKELLAVMCTCELTAELVRKWGFVRLVAIGTSMVPVIHPGDLLHVKRTVLGDISVGDIVVYARKGKLIVHRAVAVGAEGERAPYLVTRGDRSPRNDPPIFSSELIGLVATLERDHRRHELHRRVNLAEQVIRRVLRSSDRATYLYLRATSLWGAPRFRGAGW